jgi:hypothetical protein
MNKVLQSYIYLGTTKISSHFKVKAKLGVFPMGMSIKYPHILRLKLT